LSERHWDSLHSHSRTDPQESDRGLVHHRCTRIGRGRRANETWRRSGCALVPHPIDQFPPDVWGIIPTAGWDSAAGGGRILRAALGGGRLHKKGTPTLCVYCAPSAAAIGGSTADLLWRHKGRCGRPGPRLFVAASVVYLYSSMVVRKRARGVCVSCKWCLPVPLRWSSGPGHRLPRAFRENINSRANFLVASIGA
jgi:hypothetical protein